MRRASLFEVGPRDGLQNEPTPVAVAVRRRWIEQLVAAGLRDIEVGAMVREDRVPQMASTGDLFASLPKKDGVNYWLLVPNARGLDNALSLGAKHLSFLASVSDTFNQKNIGKTAQQSVDALKPLLETARAAGAVTRTYLSCAYHCPYDGPMAADATLAMTEQLWAQGSEEIAISDTIGKATPREVTTVGEGLLRLHGADGYSHHFHDTYAMGVANVAAALALGFTRFDASAGGLGGCPYAKGASGNVASEDVLFLLHNEGYDTGIDLPDLVNADGLIQDALGRPLPSKVFQALYRLAQ